jgi:hypothetical protein
LFLNSDPICNSNLIVHLVCKAVGDVQEVWCCTNGTFWSNQKWARAGVFVARGCDVSKAFDASLSVLDYVSVEETPAPARTALELYSELFLAAGDKAAPRTMQVWEKLPAAKQQEFRDMEKMDADRYAREQAVYEESQK